MLCCIETSDMLYLKYERERNYGVLEIEDNIQWHPAFCSAMELELRENKKDLQYIREYNLSKMPLKIDFLIIKKNQK